VAAPGDKGVSKIQRQKRTPTNSVLSATNTT
jgi:hypothetical protein